MALFAVRLLTSYFLLLTSALTRFHRGSAMVRYPAFSSDVDDRSAPCAAFRPRRDAVRIGGAWRRVWLSRDDGAGRSSGERHAADGACVESVCLSDRRLAIREGRVFFVVTLLAVCARIDSVRVSRRHAQHLDPGLQN